MPSVGNTWSGICLQESSPREGALKQTDNLSKLQRGKTSGSGNSQKNSASLIPTCKNVQFFMKKAILDYMYVMRLYALPYACLGNFLPLWGGTLQFLTWENLPWINAADAGVPWVVNDCWVCPIYRRTCITETTANPTRGQQIGSYMFFSSPPRSHTMRSGLLCVDGSRVWHCTCVTSMSITALPGLESCTYVMRKIPFYTFFHILQCTHCLAAFLQIMKMPWLVLQEQKFCHSKAKMHPATCPLILLCSTLCAH